MIPQVYPTWNSHDAKIELSHRSILASLPEQERTPRTSSVHSRGRIPPWWGTRLLRRTWRSLDPTAQPIMRRVRRMRQMSPHALMTRYPSYPNPPILAAKQLVWYPRNPSTQCPSKLSFNPTNNSSRVLLSRVCPNATLTSLTGTSPCSTGGKGPLNWWSEMQT